MKKNESENAFRNTLQVFITAVIFVVVSAWAYSSGDWGDTQVEKWFGQVGKIILSALSGASIASIHAWYVGLTD